MIEFPKNSRKWFPSDVFEHTNTTYKFFWFLSILELSSTPKIDKPIPLYNVVAKMVAKSWQFMLNNKYVIGKTDKLPYIVKRIAQIADTTFVSQDDVYIFLIKNKQTNTLSSLYGNVPFFFLTPWLGKQTSRTKFRDPSFIEEHFAPYSINNNSIIINKKWFDQIIPYKDELINETIIKLTNFIADKNHLENDIESFLRKNILEVSFHEDEKQNTVISSENKSANESVSPAIINGRILRIDDKALLQKIIPLLDGNKLNALKIVCDYYKDIPNLSMSFSDWAILLDSIDVNDINTKGIIQYQSSETFSETKQTVSTISHRNKITRTQEDDISDQIYQEFLSGQAFYFISTKYNLSPEKVLSIIQGKIETDRSADVHEYVLTDLEKSIYDKNTDNFYLSAHASDKLWMQSIEGINLLYKVFGKMPAFPCVLIEKVIICKSSSTLLMKSVSPKDKQRYIIELECVDVSRIRWNVEYTKKAREHIYSIVISSSGSNMKVMFHGLDLLLLAQNIRINSVYLAE